MCQRKAYLEILDKLMNEEVSKTSPEFMAFLSKHLYDENHLL